MKPLGTGGPIKKAENLIGPESPFLTLNGDIFADVDYEEIVKKHENTGAVATLALHRVKNPGRYGVAELQSDGRIQKFIEKPKSTSSTLINAGVYVFSRKIFKYIPSNAAISLERQVFPILAEKGLLYGQAIEGTWTDIGKPEDYVAINKQLLRLMHPKQPIVNRKAEVLNPVAIDRKVTVGDQSKIGPCTILGMNVFIGKNVQIRETIVFPNTTISDSCTIEKAIIGENVKIGEGVKIGRGCIIADHVNIKSNITLAKRVSVCPASNVSKSVLTSNRNC
jgi:mannose-1-phosphate guanylyltransferase